MSYLTSRAPSAGPSAVDVLPSRFTPLTPPETDAESAQATPHESAQEVDPSESQQAAVPNGTPSTHFRRPSGLLYTNHGLPRREPRPTSKQSRWLVMVMPPASLNHEPPALGHTLSLAPTGRFSNGILMPLFPTLYGQLTAIAKEFNMPSTTGLCIYLQLSESGVPMFTPRISDESWQLLWGHVFAGDERTVRLPPHGLPILGRVEFDIDLRRAKWFDSWMGYARRDKGESEYVSRGSSVVPTHWRTESRGSALLEGGNDESPPLEDDRPTTNSLPTVQRQVPRPLLLEKRDVTTSIQRHGTHAFGSHRGQSPSEGSIHAAVPQIEDKTATIPAPPFAQENEPRTARKIDLQTKVHQWRQSSSVTSTIANTVTAAGQPTLDPVNMPSGVEVEIDLNEYSWSISSAGPPSQSPESATWPEPLPSVDIPRRLQGSVCLTPSTATSFGPLDDDFTSSPISNVSRRPSVDLGARMLDYAPLTPTTATSWGPPDSPLSLPPSPQRIRTPDAAERAFPDIKSPTRTLNSQPWRYVWPYHSRSPQGAVPPPSIHGHRNEFSQDLRDFSSLSPSDSILDCAVANKSIPVDLPREIVYPALEIYPNAYPYNLNEIYPSSNKVDMTHVHNVQHPRHELANETQLVTFSRDNVYPFLEIYPAAYPHNLDQIYPVRLAAKELAIQVYEEFVQSVDVAALGSESWLGLTSIPPDHPGVTSAAVPSPRGYPHLVLYEAVYPYNLEQIYPEITPRTVVSAPSFSHGYKTEGGTSFSQSLMETELSRSSETKSMKSELRVPEFATLNYPQLSVYPSVYPWNLEELYGVTQSVVADFAAPQMARTNDSIPSYPVLIPYPPYNGFATVEAGPTIPIESPETTVSVKLTLLYPNIEPYEPVYPHLVIYPQTQINGIEQSISTKPISPRKRAPTPGPGRRRSHSQSPTLLSREELENTRRPSRSLVKKELAPPLPPGVTVEAGSRRRKTHDELHRLVFANASPKDSEEFDDHAGNLSERSIAVSPDSFQQESGPDNREIRRSLVSTPTKRRSRSGTMSSQPSGDSYRNAQRSRHTVSPYSSPPIQPRSRSGTVTNRPSERLGPRISTSIGGPRLNSLSEDAMSPESPSSLSSSRFSHSPSNTRLPLASSTMSSAFSGSSSLGGESGLPGRKYSLDSSMQLPPPLPEGNASKGNRPRSLLNARVH